MEKIYHRGVSICYFDYRGMEDPAIIRKIEQNVEAVEALVARGERNLLRLTDLRQTYASDETVEAFKNAAVRLKPHFTASAVIGVKGGKKFLLDVVSRFSGIGVRPFDDIEKAKDWLAEQSLR
jgi:hypothetical protein